MTQPASDGRPLPWPNPTTQPFFDATRRHELRLPRCPRDGYFFYPRTRCPRCLRDDWEWAPASGRGHVHSFTVDRVGHDPGQVSRLPLVIAVIDLDEGPRLTANVLGVDPDEVFVGMPVRAIYEDLDEITLLHFEPL